MICPHCNGTGEVDALEVKNSGLTLERLQQEAWFAEYWALYPRHVGKASALKAWKKAATSEAIKDEIMAGLKAQLPEIMKVYRRDRTKVPHASTWLNGLRWEDDATPDVANATKRVATRVIACELCGDSGIRRLEGTAGEYLERCSCARGALPGLVIPQAEETPF